MLTVRLGGSSRHVTLAALRTIPASLGGRFLLGKVDILLSVG